MIRISLVAAVVLLVGSGCGGSGSVHGGSGVVTAHGRVGPLRIDFSTRAAIVAFAGKPDAVVTGKSSFCCSPRYHALGYVCQRGNPNSIYACQTVYYVNSRTRRLAAFETDSPRFHTANGIRPGMAQAAADRREHQIPHGPWNAIGEWSRNAGLVIQSSCRHPVTGPCGGKVIAFMLESNHHGIGLTAT